ncbi:MAG TPA: PilZ domain-containing protein [Kofleriaceae bacterium]|nr:PilZ domain-containing protein [Kofleriaceae bacterium]
MHDLRRSSPRIEVEALCWELVGDHEVSSFVVDVSGDGMRLERPFVGGRIAREVPLQLEVPGIDEVMWARGDVVFDQLVPTQAPNGGPYGLLRRTGIRIAMAAARDLRLLRDYVYAVATLQEIEDEEEPDFMASCYLRG